MKTEVKKSANSVQEVNLSEIVVNSYNPRKFIHEREIRELTESIKEFGVLQPVLLRKKADKFELVYGERRFRAALSAEVKTIPANVMKLSDEQALEICLTENLQRENIRPIEEAAGFAALLETKKFDFSAIAGKICKSEAYVRNRIKLNDLITPISEMVNNEELSLSVGLCLATYSEDIQDDVFKNHLQQRNYSWWGNLSAKNFTARMEDSYSLLLDKYTFDRQQCVGCPHNTNSYSIFPAENEGKCNKRDCLLEMNSKHLVSQMLQIADEQNIQYVCVDTSNTVSDTVIDAIEAEGLFLVNDQIISYPDAPEKPKEENFEFADDYAESMDRYEQELKYYREEKAELENGIATGKYEKCILIKRNRLSVEYAIRQFEDDPEDERENDGEIIRKPLNVDHSAHITKLKEQDRRNREIVTEHVLEDAKKLINGQDSYSGEMSEFETKMMYYFMSGCVSYDKSKKLFGCDGHPTAEKRKQVVETLTSENMVLIIREFIRVNFCSSVYRGHAMADDFLQFVEQHFPAPLVAIQKKYTDVYEKRKAKIDSELLLLTREMEASESRAREEEAESTSTEAVSSASSFGEPGETPENEIMTVSETVEDYPGTEIGTDESTLIEVA